MMINIQTISGRLLRIRFRNDDNQYTVADFLTEDTKTTITVVGFLVGMNEGETLNITGTWEKHARFGQQFKIDSFEPVLPSTLIDIKAYLSTLELKGLSKRKINVLVESFQEQTLEVIENTPEKLKEIKGFGKVLTGRLIEAFRKNLEIKGLLAFLREYGFPLSCSAQIYRKYGSAAVDMICNEPYLLIFDFPEIGFGIVDTAARQLGIDRNNPQRIQACILYLLDRFSNDGHVFALHNELLNRCSVQFGIDAALVKEALDSLSVMGQIVMEELPDRDNQLAVFPAALHEAEIGISLRLKAMLSIPVAPVGINSDDIIEEVLQKLAVKLSKEQLTALEEILSHRAAIITGGPGTGKTTLIRSVAAIFSRLKMKTILAAPTGRAARRIAEVTGKKASTIHKLLKFNFAEGVFEMNRDNQLDTDVLIVDESSMVDTSLMYHLLNAVPITSTIIFVGDIFQLPSVGPGNVLSDLISSEAIKTFELTKIFRQAQESAIVMNAHKVRYGKFPDFKPKDETDELAEFYFIETAEPATVMERIVELCSRRIPDSYKFDPIKDVQVLTPMHKGEVGTISLNSALQNVLNPVKDHIESYGRRFKAGDKVMHLKNNYEKDVFNGDIGTITSIEKADKELTVNYYGREVAYEFEELDELTLAYAITVHKSQGSEYPAIVVPITTQHHALLQRNLLYTAMTRGKELVIIIGTRRALTIALNNDRPTQRLSCLAERLRNGSAVE